jgi:hypothetical protein
MSVLLHFNILNYQIEFHKFGIGQDVHEKLLCESGL